ncbi:MAG: DAK2 domain-containing protein [Peptoniphilus sp.]|nr:DAK2 domain-containing protein [Peptoniphilus sp.]
MNIERINGTKLAEAFTGAVNYLILYIDEINALNVFPVPDGDTGTNMSLTAKSSLKQVDSLEDKSSIYKVAEAMSTGSLMGARGNSGVILSQYLRGFSEGLKGRDDAGVRDLALAFKSASETTYKAVMKPTEGTILTVGREAADFAVRKNKNYNNIIDFLTDFVKAAKTSLDKTPEKLQVLKDAGVVDAGGKGLVVLFEGLLKALRGERISATEDEVMKAKAQKEIILTEENQDIKFGYCTEFIIKTDYEDVDAFKEKLSPMGDCLLVVGGSGSGIIKVHIHTNNPGVVLENALELGGLQDIKIDNMRFQHQEILFNNEELKQAERLESANSSETVEKKESSFIVVSLGKGINEVFKSLGADYIVEGGQTMNPSTEDFINAIDSLNSENIYIVPNNGNIILAANQARDLSEKNVFIIPTKSIPEGVTAMLSFNSEISPQENVERMTDAIKEVKSAQVTYAVRDTNMNGQSITSGDIIGLGGKEILSSGKDVSEVTKELISKLVNEDTSMITLFWGYDLTEEDARRLYEDLDAEYEDLDIDLIEGNQPLYYYLISLE